MKIEIHKIPEPLLEFGNGTTNPFIKDALLSRCGPFESTFYKGAKDIQLGLVCLESETEHIIAWVDSLRSPIFPNESNALRFREFLGAEDVLRARFMVSSRHIAEISDMEYLQSVSEASREKFDGLLDLYAGKIESLFGDNKPDCILVQFPEEIATLRVVNSKLSFEERQFLEQVQEQDNDRQLELFEMTIEQKHLAEELLPQAEELLFRNFHRALKAKCMNVQNSVPLQVIRQHTYIPNSSSQTPSTIAWNIGLAMYYKAGNIPWRLHEIESDTCFVGISFHYLKRRGGDMVYASVAQAFSSTGEGFALKGAVIPRHQTRRKQPYLTADQAGELMTQILDYYKNKNGSLPARVVVHKSSQFQVEEREGFKNGTVERVPSCQLVWLIPSGFRLLRRGMEPPERGTLCVVERKHVFLFTTGYVQKWHEYPGPHIPSPLEIGVDDQDRLLQVSQEILALTKMNWNSAEGIGRHPITLSFARRVGMIMTELDENAVPNPLYRYYM